MPTESMISVQNLIKRFGHFTAVSGCGIAVTSSSASSGRGGVLGTITQGIVLTRSALGCALAAFQAARMRLNEPPDSSPGLSAAMPWVTDHKISPRPEGAPER